MKRFAAYLLATRKDGPVGVTSDLVKRASEHSSHAVPGFTARYNVDRLVWYEMHESAEAAITREKSIKRWRREWKIALIEAANPEWNDLRDSLGAE